MTGASIAPTVITSDQEAILAARAFAASIAPDVIERDRAGALPAPVLADFDASGLLAITLPRASGATDVSIVTLAEVIRTVAAVDPAIAQAKAFASEVAVEVTSDLFALTGASATDERHDLSRHWRNARTHASHDPVDRKYHHVGNFLLNNAYPPNHGQL